MAKKSNNNLKLSFEEGLQELESITEKLSKGGLGLEETIKNYERGMELREFCMERLNKATEKIKVLVKEQGKFIEKDFTICDDKE